MQTVDSVFGGTTNIKTLIIKKKETEVSFSWDRLV
jgi:hypothetical protein